MKHLLVALAAAFAAQGAIAHDGVTLSLVKNGNVVFNYDLPTPPGEAGPVSRSAGSRFLPSSADSSQVSSTTDRSYVARCQEGKAVFDVATTGVTAGIHQAPAENGFVQVDVRLELIELQGMKEIAFQGACTSSVLLLQKMRTSNTFYAKPGQDASLPFSSNGDQFTLTVKVH